MAVYYWHGTEFHSHKHRCAEIKFYFSKFFYTPHFHSIWSSIFHIVILRNFPFSIFLSPLRFRSPLYFSQQVFSLSRRRGHRAYPLHTVWLTLGRAMSILQMVSLSLSLLTQPSRALTTVFRPKGLHDSASKHSCLHTTHSPWYPTAPVPWSLQCFLVVLSEQYLCSEILIHVCLWAEGQKDLACWSESAAARSQELSGIPSHLSSCVPTSTQVYGPFIYLGDGVESYDQANHNYLPNLY